MSKLKLPEIEVVGVPGTAARSAAMLINDVAEYFVNIKRIGNGQTWAREFDAALVVVRCFKGTRGEQPILRLVDADNTAGEQTPLLMALATFLYVSAMQKLDGDGDREAALQELKEAVELFPGISGIVNTSFPSRSPKVARPGERPASKRLSQRKARESCRSCLRPFQALPVEN